MPKTYFKHVHDSSVKPGPPDLHTLCSKIVPPSEITNVLAEVTCHDCKWMCETIRTVEAHRKPRMK